MRVQYCIIHLTGIWAAKHDCVYVLATNDTCQPQNLIRMDCRVGRNFDGSSSGWLFRFYPRTARIPLNSVYFAMAAAAEPSHVFAWNVHADVTSLSASLAENVIEAANKAIEQRGHFHIALSGGSLPKVSSAKEIDYNY